VNPEHTTPNENQTPNKSQAPIENETAETGTGERTPNRAAELARRVRQQTGPRITAAASRIGQELGTRHTTRATPKARLAQLGAAAVAAGVLGVTLGNAGQQAPQTPQADAARPTQQVNVAPAAHAAPLAAAPMAAPAAAPTTPPANNLDGWISQAHQVLLATGTPPDKINTEDLRAVIEHESGGNPTVTNNWDSNAKKGTPSKGLMQTIDPTFQAFAAPGHQDIYNPVDNIIAGVRYAIARYGSVSAVPGVVGMKTGTGYRGY